MTLTSKTLAAYGTSQTTFQAGDLLFGERAGVPFKITYANTAASIFPDGGVVTAKIADDAVTLAKIADAALSGSDATLVTGTAGTDGNLAQWNADGDLVDGPDVLDEDDFASDSASAVPTQQSVKAYVDAAATPLTLRTEQTGTGSETSFDFTSIPAGVNEIDILFDGLSLTGSDNMLVQLGDSGGVETTSYASTSQQGTSFATSTAGLVIIAGASDVMTGIMTLRRMSGEKWIATHTISRAVGTSVNTIYGAGDKTLSAALDRIRITKTGTDTFDAGSVTITYR